MFILVGAVVTWFLVAVCLWYSRPDLAQPLATLGAAFVSGLVNHIKKGRGKHPRPHRYNRRRKLSGLFKNAFVTRTCSSSSYATRRTGCSSHDSTVAPG